MITSWLGVLIIGRRASARAPLAERTDDPRVTCRPHTVHGACEEHEPRVDRCGA
jgi:hypothetical protein